MDNPFAYIIPKDLSEQATPEALQQTGPEVSEVPFAPIEASTFKRPPTQPETVALDEPDLSQAFIDDMRMAMLKSTDKDINPHSLGRTPRQVLVNAIAQQALNTTFEPSEDMGALSGYWSEFKKEMQPSVFGAVARGAKEAVIPSTVGLLGSAGGSVLGLAGTFIGGYAGGKLGQEIQETVFPPTPEDVAQAMFDFSIPETRYGRMLGNYLPGVLNYTQKLGIAGAPKNQKELISAAVNALIPNAVRIVEEGVKSKFKGEGFVEGMEEAMDPQQTLEQLLFDTTFALLSKPNKVGNYLFSKKYRTERAAQQRAANAMVQAAGEAGPLKAAERIAFNEGNLNVGGVELGSGDLSQNVGLIGAQGAIERRNNDALTRRIESLKRVGTSFGEKLDKEVKSPEYLNYQFAGQNEQAIKSLMTARDKAIARNDQKANQILSDALKSIDEARQKAASNLLSMDQAFAHTTEALQSATENLMANLGMSTKEQVGKTAQDRIATNKAFVKANVEDLYVKAAESGAVTDFSNTIQAAREAFSKRSLAAQAKGMDLPPRIEGILKKYSPDPETGVPQIFPITELRAILSEVTADIREKPQENLVQKSMLNKVKDGLLADLDAAGKVSESVRKANAAYKDYADRFLNKSSSGILEEDPSLVLDKYLSKPGLEEIRRLRSALVVPGTDQMPSGIADILATHQLNTLANKNITTSKKLTQWMLSNEGTRFLETFPETRRFMENVISGISEASKAVDAALDAQKSAAQNVASTDALAKRQEQVLIASAEDLKKAGRRKAEEKFQQKQQAIIEQAATRFIGPEPLKAFSKVMASDNPTRELQNIAARALLDPSGGAIEALRNVARTWLNDEVRNAGKALMDSLDPKQQIDPNSRRVSDAKLTALLTDAGQMQALSVVLDARELEALNLAQRQMNALSQRIGLSSGESQTRLNAMTDLTIENGLQDNLLSGVFQILRSIDPSYRKRNSAVFNSVFGGVAKAWRGDVSGLALDALQDAMSNPQVAIEMLRNPNANPKRTEAFLKNWLLWHDRKEPYRALPFSVQNVSKEELPNGKIAVDTRYGYKIYETPNKKFRLVSPTGNVSIHESFTEAENKAVSDFNLYR